MSNEVSKSLFAQANRSLVGGVNSPVRAYSAVGGSPLFIKSGQGARITSEDDQELIDYVLSYGPLILGHARQEIIQVIAQQAALGTTFGAPTQLETRCAEKIKQFYSYIDKVRFVSSGTEATMSAIRLARGATKRSIIIKFRGCYHGHADPLLVASGSGGLSLGLPDSAGVLEHTAKQTLVLEYNDKEAVKEAFVRYKDEIAGVIIEPVCGNMGVILPDLDFMQIIRQCCDQSEAILIFDEVMCGFRAQITGTHEWIGVEPDIVVLGKVIGGGLPCGVYAGKKEIMSYIAPEGPVYQAGTLSGNPLAMAAGLKTLEMLENGDVFTGIQAYTQQLTTEIKTIAKHYNIPLTINMKGSMFSMFFTEKQVTTFDDVSQCDLDRFSIFFNELLKNNVFLPPSQFEACFVSSAHQNEECSETLDAIKKGFEKINV